MPYIPLVEHSHPRIMMLDFAATDVVKFQQAGFEARRGATGLLDRNEFYFPYATQDVEVLFAQVQDGSFTSEDRKPIAASVEDRPFFRDLLREIWNKAGWSILFIAQKVSPDELASIGLEQVGVIRRNRNHMPESIRAPFLKLFERYNQVQGQTDVPEFPPPQMPRFVGQAVQMSENPEDLEIAILQRYIKSAQMSVFTCLQHPLQNQELSAPQPHIEVFGKKIYPESLIQDTSTDVNIMALKLKQAVYTGRAGSEYLYNQGGILLLPDFRTNNGNVALALLQEVIPQLSPHLFDTPQHPWLENYQPAPVLRLQSERAAIIEDATQKIQVLAEQAEIERGKYEWLLGLLVSAGDQFAVDAAQALRFVGFEVEEVDATLAPKERRREDLRIWDMASGYFALGEAKTTGKARGPSEDFIAKTLEHQMRYTRENPGMPPPALLLINYALDLDPAQRANLFYQREVAERLERAGVSAINSVALFDL